MKDGIPLASLSWFPAEARQKLRDELSVTTAEEFIGLAESASGQVSSLIDLDEKQFADLVERVFKVLPADVQQTLRNLSKLPYPYSTGLDP